MRLNTQDENTKDYTENRYKYYTISNQLKCLALFSTIKPMILWCTTSSIFSFFGIILMCSKSENGNIATIAASIFSNLLCQCVFFSLLISRLMSVTIEHYLTASFTLFNDLILIIPRYVLWELIFTSRWVWLSLHFFSATYSIFKLWDICTLFLLEIPNFLSTFFFLTGGLSFIRFFGKNQNIFLISSKLSVKPLMAKFNCKERKNALIQFFELTNYFISNGGSGNIRDSFIFTILTFLLTIPIYCFGINTPGVSNFLSLINKFYSFKTRSKMVNELGSFTTVIYLYSTSLFIVSFYWYCIELQSYNFRNLSLIDMNGTILRHNKFLEDNFNENIIPSDCFIRFITNVQKKFVFIGYKLKLQQIWLNIIYSFYSLLAIPTILPVIFLFNSNKINDLMDPLVKVIPVNSNTIFEEWLVYEYNLFFILNKLQRQLDNIFSAVLLVDSSIQTKITVVKNGDFRLIGQPTIGLDKRISFSQINVDDWFLNVYPLGEKSKRRGSFPRSVNEWWYSNILFSDSLNNPKIKDRNRNISLEWDISNSVLYHRSEIFCILLEKLKCRSKTERNLVNSKDELIDLETDGIMPQLTFLMQEMVLYTVDLCYLYIYCYHRFVAKNLLINGSKSEWGAQTLNQYINLSMEVKNRIYFALEVGILNSPYIHPVFEQEITRLYRGIEDSLDLLLSLV
ncbi:transmembrane domain-containing protein [Cryptosporidium canis]|uniref:Transmembrane domain-containing protein n=1 Tax=Cryptosporidium canis TaxID=195482 RepID=A0A9D5DHW8_9CRYT|nr:transmembrane domain-containing protein [Cryptosporidium canis]